MLDHILCYPDARPSGPLGDDGKPLNVSAWDDEAGRTWMPVDCIVADAVISAAGELVKPAIYAPGSWMVVRTRGEDAALAADPRCLLIADSERAGRGEPFVLVCKLNPDTLLGKILPVFAGDRYPFPAGPASNLESLMVVDT